MESSDLNDSPKTMRDDEILKLEIFTIGFQLCEYSVPYRILGYRVQ